MRPSGRKLDEMRSIQIETNVTKHAEGSCLIRVGDTHVLCTATVAVSYTHLTLPTIYSV